jgi:hypothetical protein
MPRIKVFFFFKKLKHRIQKSKQSFFFIKNKQSFFSSHGEPLQPPAPRTTPCNPTSPSRLILLLHSLAPTTTNPSDFTL